MHALIRNTLALLAVLVLLPSTAFAQLGNLQGLVTDTSGAVLPGVTVEAASPVLIEGVRTTVTGGEGRYTIVQLRPGTYTVTFTLPGFATVLTEDVNINAAGTGVVNAQMQVGGLEETVTVTGEAPVVDVTTSTRAAVLDADTMDALPSDRNYLGLARLIPGATPGGDGGRENNVGGSAIGEVGGDLSIHGSRENDQRVTLNGVPTHTLQAGGGLGGQAPDIASATEVTIEHTAVSADLPTGGLRINFVPRDGGNTFSSSNYFGFSNSGMQADNLSQSLKDRGLRTPDSIDKNWDLNFAIGGPIVQDRAWFWFSGRRQVADRFVAGVNGNKNAFNPNAFLYVRDTSVRGMEKGTNIQSSLRVTWQASARNKIAGTYKRDRWCTCPDQHSNRSPEAVWDFRFPRLTQEHLEWTSPVTNNLLLEWVGLHLFERWGLMHPHTNAWASTFNGNTAAIANAGKIVSINDQGSHMIYGKSPFFRNTLVPNYAWRAAATYVTGTHNLKIGINNVNGTVAQTQYQVGDNLAYRFRNGVPNRITLNATPYTNAATQNYDFGLFVQDTITLNRFTIGGAVRFDWFKTSFDERTVGAAQYTPERNYVFPAGDILTFTDVSYRSSVTYDVFGNGRTALKFTASKYLEGQTLNGIGRAGDPVSRMANNTNINWNDADGDFHPDCNLLNPLANGECSSWSNPGFGGLRPANSYSSALTSGFGNRESNWEYSVGVQHELLTGISVDVGFFRRNWANLQVVDNRAVAAADYTYFNLTVPSDSRLPNGGGNTLTGFRAITDAGRAKGVDRLTMRAKELGKLTEYWQGVDVNINGRLRNGLQFQFGTSTGGTTFNDCDLMTGQLADRDLNRSTGFCDRTEAMDTAIRAYAVYTIPVIDVQLSGTFQSDPGNFINANFNASNAYLASHSTLGRSLAGGAANMSVQLLEPHTKRLDRRNLFDLRIGKVLRAGGTRSVVSVDLFNALNSDAVLGVNQTFGAGWMTPREIVQARLLKISVQFDF
jgi:hypothetical protein